MGRGAHPTDALYVVVSMLGWAAPAAAYLASGVGLGLLCRPFLRGAGDEGVLIVGVGITLLAMVSHVGGVLGLTTRAWSAIALLVPGWGGLVLSLWRWRGHRLALASPRLAHWLAIVPGSVLLAAACAPPGWLWGSEYAGFDALSYHLQLPQEWLTLGRVVPLEHNVYSYLPGSFEVGVTHVAAMSGATGLGAHAPGGDGYGLLEGGGWRAIAAQLLHALHTLLAAWMVGRATRAAVLWGAKPGLESGAGDDGQRAARLLRRADDAGTIAGVLALATPWCVVVGSLAYSEMAVVALGAAAMAAALDRGLPAWKRGLLAGLLVGGACGFKATAMTFVAPGVGVALLAAARPREWVVMATAGAAAGVAMLAPWMIRNAMAGGNPVFPFASSLFGPAHWTAEQLERFAAGHAFDGSFLDRLRLLVLPDPDAGETARDVARNRGMTNPQYALLFPAALTGTLVGFVRDRRATLLLLAMLLLGTAAWLFTTHLQSRFLLPLVLPACGLVGIACSSVIGRRGAQGDAGRAIATMGAPEWASLIAAITRRVLALVLILFQGLALVSLFANERAGGPNEITLAGPSLFSGFGADDPRELPAAMVNAGLAPDARVYLLGDAAPFYLSKDLVWNTAWDASALGDAIRADAASQHAASTADGSPDLPTIDRPARWTATLRSRGISFVLVNLAELRRYWSAGMYDPDVTPARVDAWFGSLGAPIAAWPETGQALFALPSEATDPNANDRFDGAADDAPPGAFP
ncbi:MAG: hypothetical protein KDA05_07505 [Phycisphaerales bacterium]|nr:hypothetical protein [Phycisphaerales bacterium]